MKQDNRRTNFNMDRKKQLLAIGLAAVSMAVAGCGIVERTIPVISLWPMRAKNCSLSLDIIGK